MECPVCGMLEFVEHGECRDLEDGAMGMKWVREYYGVPAKRGMRVRVDGRPGVITSATHHIFVRLYCHPTWRVEYG